MDWTSEFVIGGIGNRVEIQGDVVDGRDDGIYVNGRKVSDDPTATVHMGRGRVEINGEPID